MTIYILLLLSVYAAAFETTLYNCKDPIRQENLRLKEVSKLKVVRAIKEKSLRSPRWTVKTGQNNKSIFALQAESRPVKARKKNKVIKEKTYWTEELNVIR